MPYWEAAQKSKKWVVAGAKKDEKAEKPAPKAEAKAKEKAPAKAPVQSPLLTAPPKGPSYVLNAMLRIRANVEAAEAKGELNERPYKLEERPNTAQEPEKVPGARRAAREQKKELKKRASSESLTGGEADAASGEAAVLSAEMKDDVNAKVAQGESVDAIVEGYGPKWQGAVREFIEAAVLSAEMKEDITAKVSQGESVDAIVEGYGPKWHKVVREFIEAPVESPSARKINLMTELPGGSSPTAAGGASPTAVGAMDGFMQMYLASMSMGMHQYYTGAQGYTTVMLRNIPNRYTRDMLVKRLDDVGMKGQFDFLYLPIDFNSKCNVGYAFINFRAPEVAQRFFAEFNGVNCKTCLPGFSSYKVCEVSYARVQGRDQNMENLKDEKFMEKLNEKAEWQPLFYDDQGVEVPFEKTLGAAVGKKKVTRKGSMDSPMHGPIAAPSFMMPPYPSPWMMPYAMPAQPEHSVSLQSYVAYAGQNNTFMIRNVPQSLSRDDLVEILNKDLKGGFDFLYLPLDIKTEGVVQNRGFGFINFRNLKKAAAFKKAFHEVAATTCMPPKDESTSDKACQVVPAILQTLDKQLSRLKGDDKLKPDWSPLLFSKQGEPSPFPLEDSTSVYPTVPSDAVDSRDLEKKMEDTAGDGETPSKAPPRTAKGKAKSKAKAQPMVPVGHGYGYPGFPPMMPMAAAHAAAAHSAAAMAQVHAHGLHYRDYQYAAVQHGILDPLAQAVNPSGEDLDETKQAELRKQIEYWFSTENLCKDIFLRQNMDTDGWVPLSVISKFKKVTSFFPRVQKHLQVQQYQINIQMICKVLSSSEMLELDDQSVKVRLKDEELRKRYGMMPKDFVPAAATPKASEAKAAAKSDEA